MPTLHKARFRLIDPIQRKSPAPNADERNADHELICRHSQSCKGPSEIQGRAKACSVSDSSGFRICFAHTSVAYLIVEGASPPRILPRLVALAEALFGLIE